MRRWTRTARIAAVVATGLFLWGASTACETDAWTDDRRVEVPPDQTGPAGAGELPNAPVGQRTEADLVGELILHRAMYARYLRVLATYYSERGYENKASWARAELRDLSGVRPYRYLSEGGAATTSLENPPEVELQTITVANREEVDLVEEMMLHRSMYARYLGVLISYYSEQGHENQANRARSEFNDLRRVKQYRYIIETEAPAAPLRPLESIAEADRLFQRGQELMHKGGHNVIVWYHAGTMKEALSTFKELVEKYPTSDKVDDAAYFIAEIHKEYNQERDNEIAIEWYQKAIAWNPGLDYPAWSHVAHIYDFRMHDREKALEWYQKVLDNETGKTGWRFWKNIDVANKRIAELTPERTRHAPAEGIAQDAGPAPSAPPASEGGSGAEASPSAPPAP